MANDFDWRNPDFGVRLLGDDVTPQERGQQYIRRAPKRTVKKTPKTSYGKVHIDPFSSIQGGGRGWGVTGIYAPRKDNL